MFLKVLEILTQCLRILNYHNSKPFLFEISSSHFRECFRRILRRITLSTFLLYSFCCCQARISQLKSCGGPTPLSTLHTSQSTLHTTSQFTLHTPYSTIHTPHSTLHTLLSTLHTPNSTLHTPHFTLHISLLVHSLFTQVEFHLYKFIKLVGKSVRFEKKGWSS